MRPTKNQLRIAVAGRAARVLALLLLCSAPSGRSGETTEDKPSGGEGAVPAAAQGDLAAPKGPPADNSRCFVCHANYDFNDEKLAFTHAKAGVGCVMCHGESERHSTDEDGLTPPDRMFPRGRIRFNCLGCHDWRQVVASDKKKTHLAEKPDHQAVLDGTAKDKRFCTDCHGDHRLGHRTRTWDKRTGKLLTRDGTPNMLGKP